MAKEKVKAAELKFRTENKVRDTKIQDQIKIEDEAKKKLLKERQEH